MGGSNPNESAIPPYSEPLHEWCLVDRSGECVEVQNLPEELLLYIFEFVAGEDHDVRDNISFMLVCRRWTALVTHTRGLWTTISITLDCYSEIPQLCDQARACIKHSENAPLDIIIQIDSLLDLDDDDDDGATEAGTLGTERLFKGYIDLMAVLTGELGINARRWQSFHLWLAGGLKDQTAFHLLKCLKFEVPNLQSLGVYLGYTPNAELSWETGQLLDILPGLTALKNLAIDHRFILGLNSIRPSLIVELTLIDSPSVRGFFSIGSQFTVLQRLIVDLRDPNVISGRDVTLPALTHLKASGWSTLELVSHITADKLVFLDIADADFTGSHLVGSTAYASVVALSWRSRDPTMMNGRACIYVALLAFVLAQCTVLAEIHLWNKHRDVFEQAVTKARKEGPALKVLKWLKIYCSGWEFNDQSLVEVIDMSIPGD
jgi:F-box-like